MITDYWGEIIDAVDFTFEDDFLYWLVYRRMEHGGSLGTNLDVAGISAYLGLSTQETHKMAGEGERIYELLGTMAFIFGNEPIDSLHVDVRTQQEFTSFRLFRSGALKIIETEYIGNYCGNHGGKSRQARICLLLYTNIIPAMYQAYESQRNNGEWSPQERLEFIKTTGTGIVKRVLPSLGLADNLTIREILDNEL